MRKPTSIKRAAHVLYIQVENHQTDDQRQQDAQAQNIVENLTEFAARRKDAELSVQSVLLQCNKCANPYVLKNIEDALDQVILAVSNLINKELQYL